MPKERELDVNSKVIRAVIAPPIIDAIISQILSMVIGLLCRLLMRNVVVYHQNNLSMVCKNRNF